MKKERQTIMIVDDVLANRDMIKGILRDSYEVYALPSAERLFAFLETVTTLEVVETISLAKSENG